MALAISDARPREWQPQHLLSVGERFEIFGGAHTQLERRILVTDDSRLGVHLDRRHSEHVIHPFLDTLGQRIRLMRACDQHQHLLCVKHCANPNCQCHARDCLDIAAKESCVGNDRLLCERLDPSSRGQRGAWLVKGDVAIGANARKEKLDATVRGDLLLIPLALIRQIRGVSVEQVGILTNGLAQDIAVRCTLSAFTWRSSQGTCYAKFAVHEQYMQGRGWSTLIGVHDQKARPKQGIPTQRMSWLVAKCA